MDFFNNNQNNEEQAASGDAPVAPEGDNPSGAENPENQEEVQEQAASGDAPVAPEVPYAPGADGCSTCGNTGLEVGVSLADAKECPVCHGSPFGEPKPEVTQEGV